MRRDGSAIAELVRRERGATETYRQALERWGLTAQSSPAAAALRKIRSDHLLAIASLASYLDDGSYTVFEEDAVVWQGALAAVGSTLRAWEQPDVISALKELERVGLQDFEDFLKRQQDEEAKALVARTIIPNQRTHLDALDRLLLVS